MTDGGGGGARPAPPSSNLSMHRGPALACGMRPSATLLAIVLSPFALGAQPTRHCVDAHQFLTTNRGMAAEVERDTVDDWRTGQRVVGCRVTAAGLTRDGVKRAAELLYERLRTNGWTRTPDPRDAPNEASLRFRKAGSDCLFNVYSDGLLMTEAEGRVSEARIPGPGEERFGVLAMCMPAMPAKPR